MLPFLSCFCPSSLTLLPYYEFTSHLINFPCMMYFSLQGPICLWHLPACLPASYAFAYKLNCWLHYTLILVYSLDLDSVLLHLLHQHDNFSITLLNIPCYIPSKWRDLSWQPRLSPIKLFTEVINQVKASVMPTEATCYNTHRASAQTDLLPEPNSFWSFGSSPLFKCTPDNKIISKSESIINECSMFVYCCLQ